MEIKNWSSQQIAEHFKDGKYRPGFKLAVIYMISEGKTPRELAKYFNIGFRQIYDWIKNFEDEGLESLQEKPKSGRPSKLTDEQLDELKQIILNDLPFKYGYNKTRWTAPPVMDLIQDQFGLSYKRTQVYEILKQIGYN